eukprot:XP_027322264.1 dual oxidase maturation factor 1 isoform X1 [Anas platyrhynchos]
MWPGEVEGVPWGLPECTPRREVVMLVVGDPGANFQPPRQQDDAVEWLLPLLRWHQCLLPLQHHLGRHRLRLPLCAGHFHHHPAGHPRKGATLLAPAGDDGTLHRSRGPHHAVHQGLGERLGDSKHLLQVLQQCRGEGGHRAAHRPGGGERHAVGNPVNQVNETIDYNEHFAWSFDADYDHSYSEGLEKGLPSPILYVAEKFTTESPCNMHRQYRISGRYASITLWMALCTWLISILLFSMPILLYGGYMLLLTAALMLFSLLFFITARNTPKCPIQFGRASLKTDYGGSFWLTLATGLLCLLLGLGVIILNSVRPQKLKLVFNLDEGKGEKAEGWDKPHLPDESSSSDQDVLMVPLNELCEVTTTQL